MSASTNIPTKLKLSQVVNAGPQLKFDTDTLVCLIVTAGSGIPSTTKTGVQFISDVTGTNPEVTGTGYSRQTLTSVTVAYDGSGTTLVDFSFGNITFAQNASGFSNGAYIIIADTSVGAGDSTHPVVVVCDPATTLTVVPGSLVLSSPTGGLIQWS